MDKIKVIFLGGLDELYKNMTAIEINDDIFVVGAGMKVPDKTKLGIDYVIPRYDYLLQNKDKIRGYFLCQGYESLSGALPYIYDKIPAPIYCSYSTKMFFEQFLRHNHFDLEKFDYVLVNADQDLLIKNHKISLFSVTCNIADSFGISFSTDQGNIVYLSNYVVNYDQEKGFIYSVKKVAKIIEEKTLLLISDSSGVERSGYCSPKYKLLQYVEKDIKDANGRVFFAIDTPDCYNTINVLNYAIKCGKKIICYDKYATEILDFFFNTGYIKNERNSFASIEEVNRLRPQDVFILMTGYGSKLDLKISLLASRKNDEKIIFIKPDDTFVYANRITFANEISATEALDELYKADCKIVAPPKKEYLKMKACEEDLKCMLSVFKPAYFVPNNANFKQLIAAAKIAVSLGIGLNHTNVFVLENGNVLNFENGRGSIASNKVLAGDLYIDGKGVGDIESSIVEERQKFSDDGVVIMAITVSLNERKIVAGPDVQTRGLIYVKESETLIKELSKLFINLTESELAKVNFSKVYLEQATKDICFKAIRRSLNKTPIIIVNIFEI